jgi:NAD(P)H-hydrate repair Nnr-like enzyme with NAD(P)H-hydrate dehydratase domain
MARLLGTTVTDIKASRIEVARNAAEQWNAVVVLKGAYTIVAAPSAKLSGTAGATVYVNPFATPVLATAGTGDVLAGTIAGLLAQGLNTFEAAVAGAYVHGLAGQIVGEETGQAGAVAGDLLGRPPWTHRKAAHAHSSVPRGCCAVAQGPSLWQLRVARGSHRGRHWTQVSGLRAPHTLAPAHL